MLAVLFKATKLSEATTAHSVIEYSLCYWIALFFPHLVLNNGMLLLTQSSCITTQSC